MVDRQAGRREHLGEEVHRLLAADALAGDRLPRLLLQLGRRQGAVERHRVELEPLARVVEDRLRQLGEGHVVVSESVHA